MATKSLEELLPSDRQLFGDKAVDLAWLARFAKNTDFRNYRDEQLPVSVPWFFVTTDVNEDTVERYSQYLTRNLSKPSIIMARSSGVGEWPGENETHHCLYMPGDGSYLSRWRDAAQRVMDSGASAVIGQVMQAKLGTHKDDGQVSEPMFGLHNVAFYATSTNLLHPEPAISLCFGLGSKIARSDLDIVLLLQHHDTRAINLDYSYEGRESFCRGSQETMDVITPGKPGTITKIEVPEKLIRFYTEVIPSWGLVPYHDYMGSVGSSANDLLNIVSAIRKAFGSDVEIEGCLDESGISLLQLRKYELVKPKDIELSKQPESLIYSSESAICTNRFKGDMYLTYKPIHVRKGDIVHYVYDIDKSRLSDIADGSSILLPYKQVAHGHTFGYTMQMLVELDNRNVSAIAVDDNYFNIARQAVMHAGSHVQDICPGVRKINDVTAECDGYRMQIFKNK
jgi:hypothetical protein